MYTNFCNDSGGEGKNTNNQGLGYEGSSRKTKTDGSTVRATSHQKAPSNPLDGWSFAGQISAGVRIPSCFSSTASNLGLDSLVRLARLRNSPMDFLVVTVELVLASEALLVVFTAEDWTFEAFGIDAVLGRGVTY